MSADRFWALIDQSARISAGNRKKQISAMRRILQKLRPEDVVDFEEHFDRAMRRSYSWDMWGAVYIINGGCSDDCFMDFRAWLISKGRPVFEAALRNPENLAEVVPRSESPDVVFEEFLYVAQEVYKKKTGRELPQRPGKVRSKPSGKPWKEKGSDLQIRFPKLWKKFGPSSK